MSVNFLLRYPLGFATLAEVEPRSPAGKGVHAALAMVPGSDEGLQGEPNAQEGR